MLFSRHETPEREGGDPVMTGISRRLSSGSRVVLVSAALTGITACIGTSPAPRGETGRGSRPPHHTVAERTYVVEPGDTLYSIAQHSRTTVQELRRLNSGIDPTRIEVGTTLRLPTGKPVIREIRR